MNENIFVKLSSIDCSKYIEKKNGLSYLSWAWAWGLVKKEYPSANYEVVCFDGKPYLYDEKLGYMVQTRVTIDGETITMHLPVMDNANKAMKDKPYSYKTKYGEKQVEAATMFDINTAIMRCLTKNLAMFGLGHYIYAGEDLPNDKEEEKDEKVQSKPQVKKKNDEEDLLKIAIEDLKKAHDDSSIDFVVSTYKELWKNKEFANAVKTRRNEIK